MTTQRAFVPAAGHDRWLALYDPLTKLLGAGAAHHTLIEQANLRDGQRVLDIGCGTGSLAVMLKRERPGIDVTALDPDANALARARHKAADAGLAIDFVLGFADAIETSDASFERVLSSLMLHHLTRDERRATLAEVFRVLKPGGEFHVVDFAAPEDRRRNVIARMLHRDEHLHDNAKGRFAAMVSDAGFQSIAELAVRRTLFGPIAFHRAVRPRA